MGEAAGVPIEPPEQTALADATLAVDGVVAAGVPGAGGHDALFAVILEPRTAAGAPTASRAETNSSTIASGVRDAVEAVWLAWPGGGLTPLLLANGPAAREPGAGVLVEA
jgi:phosphomevalonate kinase